MNTISSFVAKVGVISGISRTTYRKGNTIVTKITFKKADGTDAGSISMSKAAPKKKKRLNYNFKQISNLLMMTKTSNGASRVVTKALANVTMLQKKLKSGEYDEDALQSAIVHAKKLERIAKKRMKHLEEEENAKKQGSCVDDTDQREESENADAEKTDGNGGQELSREELQALMQEYRELMKEMEAQMDDLADLNDLADSILGSYEKDMDEDDLERLKKKHRADELREIVEADMRYLKDLFSRLEREKQAASSGSGGLGGSGGVSLELSGSEVPVQTEAPVMTEGGTIDLSV